MRAFSSILVNSILAFCLTICLMLVSIDSIIAQNNELCKEAIPLCGKVFDGTLRDTNANKIIWPNFIFPNSGVCNLQGNFDNTSWFSFPVCDSVVSVKITYSDCVHPTNNLAETGIQAGLYKECKHTGSVTCGELFGSINGDFTMTSSGFTPGDVAMIVLDGYAASKCNFRIEILKGSSLLPNTSPDTTVMRKGSITGPDVISCRDHGIAKTYSITKPECEILSCALIEPGQINGLDSIKWQWTITPSSGRFFANNDSFGLTRDIVFTEKGRYVISAKPVFHKDYGGTCGNGGCGELFSWSVDVLEADTTIATPIVLCPEETYLFCGNVINKDTLIYCEGINCQVTAQAISFRSFDDSNLGTNIVCNGDEFTFRGQNYSPGSHIVKDNVDCTKRYIFNVVEEVVGLNVSQSSSLLTCTNTNILSTATATSSSNLTLNFEWKNSSDQILSNANTLGIVAPGIYFVDVFVNLVNGKKCGEKESITITQDIEKPKVTAVIPTVTCKSTNQGSRILSVNPNRLLTSSTWTSPLGNNVFGSNITVDSLNAVTGQAYRFVGTASNGCIVDTSFFVPVNFVRPQLTVDGEMLTCFNPATILTLSVNMAVDSIKWSFTEVGGTPVFCCYDNSFVTPPQNTKGTYSARARSTASYCYNTGSKFIDEDKIKPELTLLNDTLWRCNTRNIDISPLNVSTGTEFEYQWSSQIGNLNGDLRSKNIEVTSEGSYILSVFNKQNGCLKSDTINIIKDTNFPQSLNVNASDISCFGKNDGSVIINGHESGGAAPFTYMLNGQNTFIGSNINNLSAGSYKVLVSDKYSCKDSLTFNIVEPAELIVETEPIIELSLAETSIFDFTSSYDLIDIESIKWIDQNGNFLGDAEELNYIASSNDLITVIVTNKNGCESRSEIKVIVDNNLKIFLPNAFSPNGDGINDIFAIFKNNIPARTQYLNIYDRYGNQVYAAKDIDWNNETVGWDGTFKGSRVEAGVYIVQLSYLDFEGKVNVINSSVLVSY